jgi:hypothetical protein
MTGELYILQAHPAAILALDIDNGKVRIAVAHPAGVPDGIQVDGLRNAIYWTNMGPWGTNGGRLFAGGRHDRALRP